MKTRTCWRCSSRSRLENYFWAKLLLDWAWLKYCERLLLAARDLLPRCCDQNAGVRFRPQANMVAAPEPAL